MLEIVDGHGRGGWSGRVDDDLAHPGDALDVQDGVGVAGRQGMAAPVSGIGRRAGVPEQNPVTRLCRPQDDGTIWSHCHQDSTVGKSAQQAMGRAMLCEHVGKRRIPDAHMTNHR
ncbi:hypothetical protein ACFQQB_14735 [Nonomuraea rubra]|uniref:hypothetical protein n=1 Tax=Nonomuraea rubra TaxID=46180 RepID=UPI0031E8DE68